MAEQPETPPRRSIRHAEKRRTSTCRFGDRVARVSVDHYHRVIPSFYREQQKQTCVATIVAHDKSLPDSRNLIVLAMGVGTKFLPQSVLVQEEVQDGKAIRRYGERVRDCHAEVLARRAFRRRLSLEMLRDLRNNEQGDDVAGHSSSRGTDSFALLQRCRSSSSTVPRFQMRPGVSLHFYSSSAPCGNAVLKKFAKLRKEKFRQDLAENEWPLETHFHIAGHAVSSGEFALLLKKDTSQSDFHIPVRAEPRKVDDGNIREETFASLSSKQRQWPIHTKTDWCPPGTTTVWSGQGSIHTCSDKLCRWNLLGLQGSLLSSFFAPKINRGRDAACTFGSSVDDDGCPASPQMSADSYGWPILSTFTVGRKLNSVTCRRAVCCRFGPDGIKTTADSSCGQRRLKEAILDDEWLVNHPAILGTSVYLDEHGIVEASNRNGQDVRFHSSLCWAWWLEDEDASSSLDCINGTNGWAVDAAQSDGGFSVGCDPMFESKATGNDRVCSRISTAALVSLFLELTSIRDNVFGQSEPVLHNSRLFTLAELRDLKHKVSSAYEKKKEVILTKHSVFCQWNRREYELK